jgi:hypothetical protein
MDTTANRIAADKLIIGVALVGAGIAGALGVMDVLHVRDIGRLWPVILIVIGLAGEAEAILKRRSDGSWVLLALGVWFLIGNFHFFGLSHGRALPVAISIAGAAIALHAVIDAPPAATETHDERHQ